MIRPISPAPEAAKSMTLWQLLCFGILTTPLAMGGLAMTIYLPTYYAIDMGLGLGIAQVSRRSGKIASGQHPAVGANNHTIAVQHKQATGRSLALDMSATTETDSDILRKSELPRQRA